MMTTEIERRFTVRYLPAETSGLSSLLIRQAYVALEAGREVRIREMAGRCVMTVKHNDGLSSTEVDIPMDAVAFERLWFLSRGRQIVKERMQWSDGHRDFFVDRYTEPANFLLAEVEFASVEDAQGFEPPDWMGEDVTALARPQHFQALVEKMRDAT